MGGHLHTAQLLAHAAALGLAAACGCSADSVPGLFQLELYDRPVTCDAVQATCSDAEGRAAQLERLSGPAYVSPEASQHAAGLYVFLELQRPDGAVGALELDVPRDPAGGGARVTYVESIGERIAFRSTRVRGSVSLAPAGCPCSDGQLELELVDDGPDGVPATADDQLRRLSRGQFGPQGDFCRAPRLEPIEDALRVYTLGCPVPARSGGANGASPRYGTSTHVDVEAGCGVDEPPPEIYDDEGGCGGDAPSEPEPATGCDPEPEESWDDDAGCEGDGGGGESCAGDSAGSGCEGDSGGGDIGCESGDAACAADAHAAARPCPRGRSAWRSVALPRPGVTLPFILPGLLLTFLQRRSRRQAASRRRSRAAAAR